MVDRASFLTWGGDESDEMQSSPTDGPSLEGEISFSSEQAKSLNDYWNSLARQADGIPSRASFDPITIPKLLPFIILYERLETDKYQVRLQGTSFVDRGISDVTGSVLVPDAADSSSELMNAALARVLDEPCGLRIVGVERNAEGKNALIEALGLPLLDDAGEPRFVVAVVALLETIDYSNAAAPLMGLREVREAVEIPLDHLLKQTP